MKTDSAALRSPKLSVIIPCRNEERFLSACLNSVLQNDYPADRLEIIVVDGMSTDATWQILRACAEKHPFIIPLRNPKQITPAALNLGIRASSGEVICRVDAHARVAPDYLRRSVELLLSSGAQNVGGAMRTLPSNSTLAAKCIAFCMSHRFGVGNSEFRTGANDHAVLTDTVFGGCFRKELFTRIGMFNENLPRSQDFELNQRLCRSGGRILLDPSIKCDYFAAPDLTAFIQNNFNDGMWALLPFAFSEVVPARFRHLAAFFALSILLLLSLASFWFASARVALLASTLAYSIANLAYSARIAQRQRASRCLVMMPLVFAIRHFAYGLGSLCGALKLLFNGSCVRILTRSDVFRSPRVLPNRPDIEP